MVYPANHIKFPVQNIAKGLPYTIANKMVEDGLEKYMTDIGLEFWNLLSDDNKRNLENRFLDKLKNKLQ